MEAEAGRLVIAHLQFQLKASIINDMLHLELFYFPTSSFYSITLPYDLLPKPANYLYENIANLFSYLETIAIRAQQAEFSLIGFSEPDLIIRDTICQGKRVIEIKIKLVKASAAQNIQSLRLRIKEQQLRLEGVGRQCDLQYKIQEEYLKAEKILAQKYLEVTKRTNYLQSKKKELELSKSRLISNNRFKKQSLERLKFLKKLYSVEHSQDTQQEEKEITISFRLTKKNSSFLSIIQDTITVLNTPSIAPILLISAISVPLLGKWAFSVTVVNVTNGLLLGLTRQTKQQNSIGICQPNTIAISTSKQLLLHCGLVKCASSPIRLTTGDTFKMVIDRTFNSLSFFANSQIVEQIQIPEKIKEERIVPFIQLYSADVIKINQWKND